MARILIVEDEEKIARFVTLELEHEGYQVEHAADGRTAVDLALERNYDLILLDVLLPQLNGMEVLRRVRKHKDVPVIMVTARDAVMDKVAGLDAGADDFNAEDNVFEITTDPDAFNDVVKALEEKNYAFVSADISLVPQTYVKLESDEDIKNMEKLLDMLDDNEDVQNTYHNWDQD